MHRRGNSIFELQITGVIVTILFIASWLLFAAAQRRPVRCLAMLATGKTGDPCPVSGAAYQVDGEARRCADPKMHLSSDPVVAGGNVRQTLPSPSAFGQVAVPSWRLTARLLDENGVFVLETTPRFWWRWLVAPLLQLLALLYLFIAVVHLGEWILGRRNGEPAPRRPLSLVCALGGIFLMGWAFWSAFSSGWGRERIESRPGAATHRVFVTGFTLASTSFAAPRAFCPVGESIAVVHDGGAEIVGTIAESSRGAITALNLALQRRP